METSSFTLADIDIEKNVIGSIMSYRKALEDVRDILSEECFTVELHRNIFNASRQIYQKGNEVDIISVTTHLRSSGLYTETTPFEVTQLSTHATGNYLYSAQVLNELCVRRKIWEEGIRLSKRAVDMSYDIGETINHTKDVLSGVFSSPTSDIKSIKDSLVELYEENISRNLQGESALTGSPTGFSGFDSRSGGLQKGSLVIIAAETSQGKTSLAMAMAVNAAKGGHGVAVYSMEMTSTELTARILSGESGITSNKYLYSPLSAQELDIFDKNVTRVANLSVYFDDNSTIGIDSILASIRTMVSKYDIKGAVVDYLQILSVNSRNKSDEQFMGEVSRRLKNIAKELKIWIVALSQLKRDDNSHVPTLGRLRSSGQIAEASDAVILVYRPEVYGDSNSYPGEFKSVSTNGTAMIHLAKGRNIGLGKFIVGFDAATTKFYELSDLPGAPFVEDENPF